MAENSLPKLISREEALAQGKTRFFNGVPCKHGHIVERLVSTKGCIICHKANQKAWVETHRDAGEVRYSTGKPCRNGHIAERMVSNRQCVACLNEFRKRRRQKYAEMAAEYYRERNREYQQKWRASNPEAAQRIREKVYSGQELKKIKEAGRGRPVQCELCGAHKETVFDHCHQCKQFRGWLCSRCNWTLGHVKDDPKLLTRMIAYLEAHLGGTEKCTAKQAPKF